MFFRLLVELFNFMSDCFVGVLWKREDFEIDLSLLVFFPCVPFVDIGLPALIFIVPLDPPGFRFFSLL